MTYQDFLESKIEIAPLVGIEVQPEEVHKILKPHQKDAVVWACRGGRRGMVEMVERHRR